MLQRKLLQLQISFVTNDSSINDWKDETAFREYTYEDTSIISNTMQLSYTINLNSLLELHKSLMHFADKIAKVKFCTTVNSSH